MSAAADVTARLYAARCRIIARFDRVPVSELEQLAALLKEATDEEVVRMVVFLDGLVEWRR